MNGIPPALEELRETLKRYPSAKEWFNQHGSRRCAAILPPPASTDPPAWPPSPYVSMDTIRTVEFQAVAFRKGDGPIVYRWVYTGPVLLEPLLL